jgi:ABC-type branched-subunit amino acid transport system substrate-binding protein
LRKNTRLGIVLLSVCLIAASCGGRFNATQKKALRAGAAGNGQLASTAGDVTAGDASTPSAAGDTTATTAAAAGSPSGGGAASTGGAAASTGGGAAAASNCGVGDNGGATDVGVTATSLAVGNVSIMSGPVPGFGRTSQSAVQAYINYVNSQGGVCGRKLQLSNSDDRFDSGANRSETEKLKSKVFAFVGGLSVVDDGGAAVLAGTNVPDVGISLSDARIKLPNNFSTAPIDLADGGNGIIPSMKYDKEHFGAKIGAVVWPGQPIARSRAQGYVNDMKRAGIDPSVQLEVSVTETNYSGVAAKIKDGHVDVLLTTLELSGMAALAKALKQQGYQPKVAAYGAQAYGQSFIDRARDAAEGVTLQIGYDIFENKAANPAIATFLKWFTQTAPGVQPDYFSVIAWSAAELFVQALRAAGAKPTRDNVLAQLKKVTKFDAGGMLATVNPAGKHWADCFLVVTVKNQKWQRVDPAASGFRC